ncbi:MAG: hypothetical protein L6Q51_13785 [Cyclobacteriaceae bacterium]|nr:hypothetical protein [Cyclobacteriaceae bacterium]
MVRLLLLMYLVPVAALAQLVAWQPITANDTMLTVTYQDLSFRKKKPAIKRPYSTAAATW